MFMKYNAIVLILPALQIPTRSATTTGSSTPNQTATDAASSASDRPMVTNYFIPNLLCK